MGVLALLRLRGLWQLLKRKRHQPGKAVVKVVRREAEERHRFLPGTERLAQSQGVSGRYGLLWRMRVRVRVRMRMERRKPPGDSACLVMDMLGGVAVVIDPNMQQWTAANKGGEHDAKRRVAHH